MIKNGIVATESNYINDKQIGIFIKYNWKFKIRILSC